MKKLLLVSLMVLLTSVAFSQDDSGGTTPSSGELLIEITSSPFGRDVDNYSSGNSSTLLSFGQFRARYVLNETLVPRLGISFSIDDNKSGISSPDVTNTVSQFMFAPGMEYHFVNQGGFTSYAAADIIITGRFAETINATGLDVTGAIIDPDDLPIFLSDPNNAIDLNDRGFFGLGLHGAVGADYHFSSRFYVGAEMGFFFITSKSSDVEVDGVVFQEGIKFFDAGIRTSNSFRIGFKLF